MAQFIHFLGEENFIVYNILLLQTMLPSTYLSPHAPARGQESL